MKLPRLAGLLGLASLLMVLPAVFSSPAAAQFGIGISVRIGPPALPVYEQPQCPGEGYLWTPGYWAWDDDNGYYWVPGTWVEAPEPGQLWTPGYWGWNDGPYAWNDGCDWGPQVGFYGGIDYGYGYGGNGFYGGEWRNNAFYYNTAVMNVNTTEIRNVYVNRTVIVNNNSHVAFNGGQGGIQARPTPQQESYMHEHHTPPVAAQVQQVHAARENRALFASNNHGRPPVAATAKPGEFSGRGVVAAGRLLELPITLRRCRRRKHGQRLRLETMLSKIVQRRRTLLRRRRIRQPLMPGALRPSRKIRLARKRTIPLKPMQ